MMLYMCVYVYIYLYVADLQQMALSKRANTLKGLCGIGF